jgi:hypothetical protein
MSAGTLKVQDAPAPEAEPKTVEKSEKVMETGSCLKRIIPSTGRSHGNRIVLYWNS